jgi:hypothetical protein
MFLQGSRNWSGEGLSFLITGQQLEGIINYNDESGLVQLEGEE